MAWHAVLVTGVKIFAWPGNSGMMDGKRISSAGCIVDRQRTSGLQGCLRAPLNVMAWQVSERSETPKKREAIGGCVVTC